jgi:hypothetical protein
LKEKWEYSEPMTQPFIDLKKAFDRFRREALNNIFSEFDISMKHFSVLFCFVLGV